MKLLRAALGASLLLSVSCDPGTELGTAGNGLTVCPAGSTVEGVDVSSFNGTVDWAQVKASGRAFAVARVSDGANTPDTSFDTNYAAIRAAGMVRGAYQFFRTNQDAAAQADLVIQKVGALGPGDLPPALTLEQAGSATPADLQQQIRTWSDRVEQALGRKPLIFTGKSFWDTAVGSNQFAGNPLWSGSWGVSCPSIPDSWSNWSLWQYSDSGTVAGITGTADLDRFNGSLAELQAFAGGTSAPDAGASGPDAGASGPDAGSAPDAGAEPADASASSPENKGCGCATSGGEAEIGLALFGFALAIDRLRRRSR